MIRNKFKSASYSIIFVHSIVHEFTTAQTNEENKFTTPVWLFEVKKKIVLAGMFCCLKNESSSKKSIKKIDKFPNDTFDVQTKWLSKKVKTLLKVKDESLHQTSIMHKNVCCCGEIFIGETIRNIEIRQDEHNNPVKKPNLSKQIKDNLDHVFKWSGLSNAPKDMFQQKVLEMYYIVLEKTTLN